MNWAYLGGMAASEDVRSELVELWGRMGRFWGISSSTARVYAWLLSRDDAATTESIMEGLSVSRGAVSMATIELLDWGLVLAERDPGSRRTRYRVEADLARVIRNIVRARKRREWDPILEKVREWIPRLEADRTGKSGPLLARLRTIERSVAAADSMAGLFLEGGRLTDLGLHALVAAARPRKKRRRS
jgi:DNA-binding transcriptional regulator GbsR (MarR family)